MQRGKRVGSVDLNRRINICAFLCAAIINAGCSSHSVKSADSSSCYEVYECINYIKTTISENWRVPMSYKEGMFVDLKIRINNEKTIDGIYVLEYSGDKYFLESVKRAVIKSSPFSFLPSLKGKNEGVYDEITLRFNPGKTTDDTTRNVIPAGDMYSYAMSLIKDKKFDDAIVVMSRLELEHGDSKYLTYCRYWLGELYLVNMNLDKSQSYFELVIDDRNSPKRLYSMFKLSKVLVLKGYLARAAKLVNELVTGYPDSEEAKIAREYYKIQGLLGNENWL